MKEESVPFFLASNGVIEQSDLCCDCRLVEFIILLLISIALAFCLVRLEGWFDWDCCGGLRQTCLLLLSWSILACISGRVLFWKLDLVKQALFVKSSSQFHLS